MRSTRPFCILDRSKKGEQCPLDLPVGCRAQILLRRLRLADRFVAAQQVETDRPQGHETVEGHGLVDSRTQRQHSRRDPTALPALDRAGGAGGAAKLRKDRTAEGRRRLEVRVVGRAVEGRYRFGIVEQEKTSGAGYGLEATAAQPAGTADTLLHMLMAMPILESILVSRIDIDPEREDGLPAARQDRPPPPGGKDRTASVKATTSARRSWSVAGT